jgi:hypothetical protein
MIPKILYYNKKQVPEIIRKDTRSISPFLSKEYSFDLFKKYEDFGLNKHNMVFDRSLSIPHYLNIAADAHPIPSVDSSFNKSFYECCEERAKHLLSLNKIVHVLWSGGLDSTFTLFMLKKFSNDPDQVRIWGTLNSIIESGDLFDRKLKHEFPYTIVEPSDNEFSYNVDDCIFVSGMGGNQLFGPTDDMFATGGTAMFHHTLGTPETIYEPYDKNIDPDLLEFLDPMIKNSYRKIETVADLRWYCIFNLDWYTGLYEHRTMLQIEKTKKMHAFFDSEDLQRWAMTTKESFTKIRGQANTHRWQMRQILSEEFGETHYALNKPKKISNLNVQRPQWLFLLDDFHNVLID